MSAFLHLGSVLGDRIWLLLRGVGGLPRDAEQRKLQISRISTFCRPMRLPVRLREISA